MDVTIALVAVVGLCGSTAASPQTNQEIRNEDPRMNILYLIADDMRPELNYAYNASHVISPNLDKLGKRSLVFEHAYAQFAVCTASRNSFMTGRRPDHTGMNGEGSAKSFRTNYPKWTTMTQHFKQSGYLTLGGGKVFHPNSPPNNDLPLSWSPDIPYYNFTYFLKDFLCPNHPVGEKPTDADVSSQDTWCRLDMPEEYFYDNGLANHTISTLQAAAKDSRPFFIANGFARPHAPWRVPAYVWDMYNNVSIPLATTKTAPVNMPDVAYHQQGVYFYPNLSNYVVPLPTKPIADTVATTWRQAYYSSVTWMDIQLGRVLDEVDTLSLTDKTIVIFHGDHGWQLGEHSIWHKETNFELGVRTSLMIAAPNYAASVGKRTKVLAELIDMYPTMVALSGVAPPSHPVDGVSLDPVFKEPTAIAFKPYALSQYGRECETTTSCIQYGQKQMGKVNIMGYSIRTAQYRYTAWCWWKPPTSGNVGKPTKHVSPTQTGTPGGHGSDGGCDWGQPPAFRELYVHTDVDGAIDLDQENENVAEMASNAAIVKALQTQLCNGNAAWRNSTVVCPPSL